LLFHVFDDSAQPIDRLLLLAHACIAVSLDHMPSRNQKRCNVRPQFILVHFPFPTLSIFRCLDFTFYTIYAFIS